MTKSISPSPTFIGGKKLINKLQLSFTSKIDRRSFKHKFENYTGQTKSGIAIIFSLKSSIIKGILHWLFLCSIYGFLISFASYLGWFKTDEIQSLPQIAIGLNFVLALLLGFRTNTAHNRFWEGRKLWGALVNTIRNTGRGILIIVREKSPKDSAEKRDVMRLLSAYAIALKSHLRKEKATHELMPLVSQSQYERLQQVEHLPLEIAFWIADYLQEKYYQKKLNLFQLNTLQKHIDDLVDILGGCERILKTPVPLIYTIVLKTLLIVYFLLLPFELVQRIGFWTAPAMAFISLVILIINEIGAEIEEPFGRDINNLPLDFICNTIDRNIHHLINLDSTSAFQDSDRRISVRV